MVDIRIEDKWKEFLNKDEELRNLASKACLTERPERVYEILHAIENSRKVAMSKEEKELAIYLYCHYS